MGTELTIPDPSREVVAPGWAKNEYLPSIETLDDLTQLSSGADNLQGHIAAYKRQGKNTKELQAAKAYTEVFIGKLLGPGERDHDRSPGAKSVSTDIGKKQRHELRRLAWREKKSTVKWALDAIANNKSSRQAIIKHIEAKSQPKKKATHAPKPDIRRGDFQKVLADIEPESVALILTDPPYPAEYLPLWSSLSEFAAEKLVPGGSLLAYSGQGNLPECIARLSEHLRYWWTLSLTHSHGSQNLPGKFVTIGWKPILWFTKDTRRDHNYVADRLAGSAPRKGAHEWAQGRDELEPLIVSLTAAGELIVDPFAGSGTTGEAALTLERRFIGAELNE